MFEGLKVSSRLVDSVALVMAALSFVALITAVAQLQTNLVVAFVAGAIAVMLGVSAFYLSARAKTLAVPAIFEVPTDFRTPLTVHRGKGWFFWILAGVIIFGLPAYLMFDKHPFLATVCTFLTAGSMYMLIDSIRRIGEPVLVLNDGGINTRKYGFIPWSDVDRMSFVQYTIRGRKLSRLNIFASDLDKYLRRLNTFERALRRLGTPIERNAIPVSLDYLSHKAGYIDAVARHLRTKYAASAGIRLITGDLSMDKRSAEIDKLIKSTGPNDNNEKIKKIIDEVDQLSKEQFAEMKEHQALLKRQSRVNFVITAIALFLFALYLMIKFAT